MIRLVLTEGAYDAIASTLPKGSASVAHAARERQMLSGGSLARRQGQRAGALVGEVNVTVSDLAGNCGEATMTHTCLI
jgi:hypothetical protein